MKKIRLTRICALIISVLMIFSSLSAAIITVSADNILFSDSFSGAQLSSAWTNGNIGKISSGKYSLSDKESNTINQIGTQRQIEISADVTVNIGADKSGIMQNSVASLVICASNDTSSGYEFGIGVTKTGVTYARLYRRGPADVSQILIQKSNDDLENVDILPGKTYRLTVGKYDNTINCFIDGEFVFSSKDSAYNSGFCGLKTSYSKSLFDNVSVRKIQDKKVSKIKVIDPPKSVSLLGNINFNVLVSYSDSFFQNETISSDNSRVSISGVNRKVGNSNIIVKVDGKSDSFVLQFVKSSDETVVFSDDFSSSNGDNYSYYRTQRDTVDYGFSITSGKLYAKLPNITSTGFNSPLIAKATLSTKYTSDLGTQYSFSADTTLETLVSGTPTKRNTCAEISCFTDKYGKVYKFKLLSTGVLQLYSDDKLLMSKSLTAVIGKAFEINTAYNLKMSIGENILLAYVNDINVFSYTDLKIGKATPKPYVSGSQGSVSFDNIKLIKNEQYAKECAKSIEIYSVSDSQPLSTYIGKEFDKSKLYIVVTYVNGVKRNVGITDDMVVGYNDDLKANQKITIQYGSCKKSFNFSYSKYLFYDSFDDGKNPNWSITSCPNTELSIKNNRLKTTWNGSNTDASLSMSANVEGSDKWRNYSVSADISFDTTMTKMIRSGQQITLFFRRTGSTYYDLRFITRGGSLSMSLYRYINGKNELVGSATAGQISAKYGGLKTATNGALFNLKAICKDNIVYIYIDGYLLMTYEETADDAPYAGYAGMKISKVTGSVDNFTVEEKGPFDIERIEIEGLNDNTFELYEGFSIDAYDYKINCIDKDGTVFVESLTDSMISDYDNLEVGTQNITISAYGKKQSAKVVVKNRDKYIKKIDKEAKKLKLSKLKLSDKDKLYDLFDRYDELSYYEITKLSDKAVENIKSAREKIEILLCPQLKNSEVIYSNDFNSESFDSSEWYDGVEKGKGEWKCINGTYRLEQERYNISATGYRVVKPVYTELESVSARMLMLSESMYMGFDFNIGEDGYYTARVKMDSYDDDGNVNPILQFIKDGDRMFTEYLSGYGLDIKANEWFTMRVTFVDNLIKVYVNDTEIISFNDSESTNYYTVGRTGVRSSNGNSKFDNIIIRGTLLEEKQAKVTTKPTKYSDNFDSYKEGDSPKCFVESNETDYWKIYNTSNNGYYGTSYKSAFTQTWLHAFDDNTNMSLKFKTDDADTSGKFGFFIRMAPETAYIRIGYDASAKKWYAIDTQNERDCDVNTTVSEDKFAIKNDKWYKLSITAEDDKVTVKVDGKKVLTLSNVSQTGFGRLGIFADGASVYVDDFKCTLNSGGNIQDGLLEYIVNDGVYTGTAEIESLDGDNMIIAGYRFVAFSSDAGKTFTVSEDEETTEKLSGHETYPSYIQLHDGSYLFIRKSEFIVYKSTDYLKTLTPICTMFESLVDELGRQAYTMHLNSFSEYQMEDGTWRVFLCVTTNLYQSTLTASSTSHSIRLYYSDDGGYTWTPSENDSTDFAIAYDEENLKSTDWAECKIVQCNDGTLRMYHSRDIFGCVQYSVSKDGGKTWNGQYQIPEMQCAKSSYNIIEDKSNKGTYYMIWVNNNPIVSGSNFARSRLSLARSTDGKNWTFLCDIERMEDAVYGNDVNSSTPLFQCIDPCIEVTDKYVYVTFGRSDGTDTTRLTGTSTNYHQGLRLRTVRIEKDKLIDQKWDNYSVSNMLFPKSIKVTKPIKTRYGLGDIFGYVGGEVTQTLLDGTTKIIDTGRLHLVEEPDMLTLGKQTVKLYDNHGMQTSYEIEIVPKYMLNWSIIGNGDVDPQENSILEGDTLSVKLKPKNIFYRVKSVKINGKKVFTLGRLKFKDVKEDQEIEVVFAPMGVVGYILLILLFLIIVEVGFVTIKSILKKDKIKDILKSQICFINSLFKKIFRRKTNG